MPADAWEDCGLTLWKIGHAFCTLAWARMRLGSHLSMCLYVHLRSSPDKQHRILTIVVDDADDGNDIIT
jgi:hypothetical protein